MTIKDFFENFEDKGGSIRIIDGFFDIRTYDYIDKKSSMWRSFMDKYGNYRITEWYIKEGFLTVHVEEDKGEGRFDYTISYNVKVWGDELGERRKVHKSQLAHAIEHAFSWGAHDMKISCVERKDESQD